MIETINADDINMTGLQSQIQIHQTVKSGSHQPRTSSKVQGTVLTFGYLQVLWRFL